ncbi:6-carboxytetrahydropterin synthase QueD [Desulfovibrio ferrophilus]|uniref:6-carboxy-5,6,7,8-tetrahydropterin synthase n=1 Tax=Desulfovibrio ferrophilus TaxID=241368 RepID=A0A2Z6B0E5_9BACT|nr:6-carboxytetrahydropterin synthase QueD [Desulfovibrio ferrophilus]BBD08910.1 queuosine biosynthesis protein QueD [Desulfovibrio ferrophilus]
MPKGKWRLEITEDFAASHQLRHYEGKCERMHGHNFGVLAAVEGDTLTPDTELLIDFKVLRKQLKAVLSELDHRHLNEVEPFTTCNPSSENLARFIYQGLSAKLADVGVRVAYITVSEKPAQSATYFED